MSERRLLFISDQHKREKDFETIGNYREAGNLVDDDIMEFIKANQVTDVVYGGDIYDRGYRNTGAIYNDISANRAIAELVGGNAYDCIGNHFFIERDSNPEMYLIQPNDRYSPSKPIPNVDKPILKTPDFIRIGDVQISLFHFHKTEKEYIQELQPGVKFHVGIYHDDCVLPQSVRSNLNMFSKTSSEYLQSVFANVDLALVAHVHNPIGTVSVRVGRKEVPMIIPGSLAITDTAAASMHDSVMLPMLHISDAGCTVTMHKFSLHADVLKFYKKEKPVLPPAVAEKFGTQIPAEAVLKSLTPYLGAGDYLRQRGMDGRAIAIYDMAAHGALDIQSAVKLVFQGAS